MSAVLATGVRSSLLQSTRVAFSRAPFCIFNQSIQGAFCGRTFAAPFHTTTTARAQIGASRGLPGGIDPSESKTRKFVGVCVLTAAATGLYGFVFTHDAKTISHIHRGMPQ